MKTLVIFLLLAIINSTSHAFPPARLHCNAFDGKLEFTIYGDTKSTGGINIKAPFYGVVGVRKNNRSTTVNVKGEFIYTGRAFIYNLRSIWHGHFNYFQQLNVYIHESSGTRVSFNTTEPEFQYDTKAICNFPLN